MTFKQTLFFCALNLFFIQLSLAQIVNIEDKRIQLDSSRHWQGRFDIKSKLTRNTSTVFALSSSLRIDRSSDKNDWFLLSSYNFVRAGEENFIDDGFAHLRYGRNLKAKWKLEAFGQVQYNQRLRINLRILMGAGPRVELLEKEKIKLAAGLLYMYEYNELNADINIRKNHRMSSYLTIRLKPQENISFSSTSYYQPLIRDFAQGRLSTINTLVIKMNRYLSFTSSFSLTFDAQLAADAVDVPVSTYQWQHGIRLVF